MDQSKEWYYLDANTQHVGPCKATDLQGLAAGGYITPNTVLWAEGRDSWQALEQVAELSEVLAVAVPGGAAAAPDTTKVAPTPAAPVQTAAPAAADFAATLSTSAAAASTPKTAAKGAAAVKATAAKSAQPVDPLARFAAEISAIQGNAHAELASATVPVDVPERADTPPPDEQSFVDDDGTAYVWDPVMRRYAEQAAAAADTGTAYGVEDMTFVAEEEKIPLRRPPRPEDGDDAAAADDEPDDEEPEAGTSGANGHAGKRKREEAAPGEQAKGDKAKKEKEEREAGWVELAQSTAVYVSGLPPNVTPAELAHVFSKCGIIKDDDSGQPKVKVYRDKDTGEPKGDGLVTYLKAPSVELALQILDGTPFRDNLTQAMSVTKAKFEQKGDTYVPKKKPKKKKKKPAQDKKVEKALGWGGFDDMLAPHLVTVVLKHMFHPDDFSQDPAVKSDLEDDIKSECSKLGAIEKLRIFQYNPEGVVTVRFKTEEAAQECIKLMNGRFFGGRQLEATMWDGFTNYYVKPLQESAEEQEARLERYAAELEREEQQKQAEALAMANPKQDEQVAEPMEVSNGV